jgi:YgiT-type zinc finger domain-containing protein
MKSDFCEYCNTPLANVEKPVTVYRHRKQRHFIFEQVPALVCPRCGERYFGARVVREMDRLMQRAQPRATTVRVPLIELRLAG